MSPQQQQEQRGVKRRKPPTFQHLPAERAKKLKRSWVEVQKIKSKWKAQKRKEGLVGSRSQLEHMVEGAEQDKPHESREGEDGDAISHSSSAESASEDSEDESGDERSEEDSADEAPSTNKRTASHSNARPSKKQQGKAPQKPEDKPSLRELQKLAYSKSSLHNHKSRPLNRFKGPAALRGQDAGRGGGGRGAPRGRGSPRGRGRGQPDMGLRMKAMLEQIKQNYT
ncbi:hypothetical protein PYCCODRAFT_888280 [Trametes coccinea BRFM310]|uniref:rRNA-processing protein FYV7 n=1 Tax=Trametes coccinea (strain BRFM310) TaxID=1353009 RepID=A0A1Y2IDD3_TRAC3|nr:hypothetical protein PYCCODRAFT_888280 [Trametes coccinea BRFM310]